MKSPFPGMDPYLESRWRDFHARFMVYACDALQSLLPPELRAQVEERVFIEGDSEPVRATYPDLAVIEHRPGGGGTAVMEEPAVARAEPVIVHITSEEVTETFIEIVDARSGNRVVTIIELLSRANKFAGEGQKLYLQKRQEMRESDVSVVEIDLLRGGERVFMVRDESLPPHLRSTYRLCVRYGWEPRRYRIYPIGLRERLPCISVPLRQQDRPVGLDLQAVLDRCYVNGRYHDALDYREPLDPPLGPEDAQWAEGLLR